MGGITNSAAYWDALDDQRNSPNSTNLAILLGTGIGVEHINPCTKDRYKGQWWGKRRLLEGNTKATDGGLSDERNERNSAESNTALAATVAGSISESNFLATSDISDSSESDSSDLDSSDLDSIDSSDASITLTPPRRDLADSDIPLQFEDVSDELWQWSFCATVCTLVYLFFKPLVVTFNRPLNQADRDSKCAIVFRTFIMFGANALLFPVAVLTPFSKLDLCPSSAEFYVLVGVMERLAALTGLIITAGGLGLMTGIIFLFFDDGGLLFESFRMVTVIMFACCWGLLLYEVISTQIEISFEVFNGIMMVIGNMNLSVFLLDSDSSGGDYFYSTSVCSLLVTLADIAATIRVYYTMYSGVNRKGPKPGELEEGQEVQDERTFYSGKMRNEQVQNQSRFAGGEGGGNTSSGTEVDLPRGGGNNATIVSQPGMAKTSESETSKSEKANLVPQPGAPGAEKKEVESIVPQTATESGGDE